MRPFLGTAAAVRGATCPRGPLPGLADDLAGDLAGEEQRSDRPHEDHRVVGGNGPRQQRRGEDEQEVRRGSEIIQAADR